MKRRTVPARTHLLEVVLGSVLIAAGVWALAPGPSRADPADDPSGTAGSAEPQPGGSEARGAGATHRPPSSPAGRPLRPGFQPSASPSVRPAAGGVRGDAADEEIPESYRKVLSVLNSRRPEEVPDEASLRFGWTDAVRFPKVAAREIRVTPTGPVLLVENDPKEYRLGDRILGARVVALTAEEAKLEFGGETRALTVKRAFPDIAIRAIRQVEGEWTVFLEGEKRAYYSGDVYREARIARIEAGGVTFQYGDETRKIAPRTVKIPFPEVKFSGFIEMPGGLVGLVKDRSEPVRVGDVIQGARILSITTTGVVLEFQGETRTVPIR